jgi:hypothetical protein
MSYRKQTPTSARLVALPNSRVETEVNCESQRRVAIFRVLVGPLILGGAEDCFRLLRRLLDGNKSEAANRQEALHRRPAALGIGRLPRLGSRARIASPAPPSIRGLVLRPEPTPGQAPSTAGPLPMLRLLKLQLQDPFALGRSLTCWNHWVSLLLPASIVSPPGRQAEPVEVRHEADVG